MRHGDWYAYCDICGQRTYASNTTKLSTYTGKGGLVVCRHDVDREDPGLKPFIPRIEQAVTVTRINHTNTDDAAPLLDLESMTLQYYLAASQDNAILMSSQDDALLTVSVPI